VRAGRLRHKVVLQSRSNTQDDFGQPVESWTALGSIYAAIEPLSGRELMTRSGAAALASHKITIRHREGITPANRILFGVRLFDILLIVNPQEMNERLEMIVQERVL